MGRGTMALMTKGYMTPGPSAGSKVRRSLLSNGAGCFSPGSQSGWGGAICCTTGRLAGGWVDLQPAWVLLRCFIVGHETW